MKYNKYELLMEVSKVQESTKDYELTNPRDVISFARDVMQMQKRPQEVLSVITLNSKGGVIGFADVSIGDLNSSLVHPREVFKIAILQNAAAIIMLHNHPSGDPEPSDSDIETTKRIAEAGEILGIRLLDHIIVGEKDGVSLGEKGML